MFEFRFGVDDLAATWFGYSPLQETVLSLRARRFPARYPEHRAWTAGWQPRYETLDTALLDSLIAPVGFVPDFLTPRPGSPARTSPPSSRCWRPPRRRWCGRTCSPPTAATGVRCHPSWPG
ncbi:hypothetical protein ACFQ0M_36600 [Kitasatospora aburaviensis]